MMVLSRQVAAELGIDLDKEKVPLADYTTALKKELAEEKKLTEAVILKAGRRAIRSLRKG